MFFVICDLALVIFSIELSPLICSVSSIIV